MSVSTEAPATVKMSRRQVCTLASLAVTASLFGYSNVMTAPLLPDIQREFGRSVAFGGLVFAVSLAAAGAATPFVVLAAEKFGNKRMLLVVLVLFTLGSVQIGVTNSAVGIVAGRALYGLVGALLPLSYAVARSIFHGHAAIKATALLSGSVGFSAGLGLFSVALFDMSYRAVVLVWWAGTGVVALVLVLLFVPMDRPAPTRVASALKGVVPMSTGLVLLLLPLLSVNWSRDHLVVAAASVVVGAALIAGSRHSREIVAPNRIAAVGNVMNVLGIAGMFGVYIAFPPIVAATHPLQWLGSDLTVIATVLLLPSVASLVGSQLSGRYTRLRGSGGSVATVGGLVATCGLVLAGLFPGTLWVLVVGITLTGLGCGGAFNGIVEAVSQSGSVAARTGTLVAGRYVGGALGSALVAVVLDLLDDDHGVIDAVGASLLVLALLQLVGVLVWMQRGRARHAAPAV